ncbi:hypothetical protein GLW04_06465 [Halobacillus litoralis]|uniref:TetR family transcriptional regulator n=1 Tax=Halobacillus litoralis TaxID=45668 RepID=A0A845DRN9_9BACI|nr:hypothetical protein [Halobacillus litoralis]
MENRISHQNMDELLEKLEDDYLSALKHNDSKSVDEFIDQFLYDSWEYNDRNMEDIKEVMGRYTEGGIKVRTFSGAFNEMVDYLKETLESLDPSGEYPLLHTPYGASALVAFVDGLIIQYFTGVYTVDDLKEITPGLKQMLLTTLAAEAPFPEK